MNGRLTNAVVAIVAVLLTVGVYETWNAINETVAAVDSVVPSAPTGKERKATERKASVERDATRSKTSKEPIPAPAAALEAVEKRERAPKEEREERLEDRAGELGVSLQELRAFRLEKKADEKGLSADELRDKRQTKKANQEEIRREKRAEWRSKQDVDELKARKQAKREEMSPEQAAARAERREYRDEVVEEFPSVGDAAKVLQQLRVMGQAGQEQQ